MTSTWSYYDSQMLPLICNSPSSLEIFAPRKIFLYLFLCDKNNNDKRTKGKIKKIPMATHSKFAQIDESAGVKWSLIQKHRSSPRILIARSGAFPNRSTSRPPVPAASNGPAMIGNCHPFGHVQFTQTSIARKGKGQIYSHCVHKIRQVQALVLHDVYTAPSFNVHGSRNWLSSESVSPHEKVMKALPRNCSSAS